jgi:hypothetical protein
MGSEAEKIISYSLLESERVRSIREWAATPTPDHARHLIRTYRESEWRSTRLEVLRHFGHFQDSRSLQFLTEIATKNEDLAEQQLAILALSQRRTRTAQVFLRRFYKSAPDTLKPHLAYALGQAQDFSAIPILIKDWDTAYARQDWLWLRNMILALGELKAFEVLPRLRKLVSGSVGGESELMFATLFALARLERDALALQQYESRYVEDSLLYQIFQSTLSQIQIRSQFKLEDYLDKVFTSPDPHPILPLELHAFDVNEVEEGLSVFSLEQDWKRFLIALKGLPSKKRVSYLEKILPLLTSEEDQLYFLSQITGLIDDENQDAIFKLLSPFSKSENGELRLKWLEAVAHVVDISKEAEFFFEKTDSSLAIRYLNLWSEWTLVKDGAVGAGASAGTVKTVQDWIQKFKLSSPVYARLIRACAELGVESKAIFDRFASDFKEPALRNSLLLLVEAFPKALPFKTLMQEVAALSGAEKENLGQRFLAVIEAYALSDAKIDVSSAPFHDLLKLFSNHFNVDFRVGVLRYLRAHPEVALKPDWEKYVIEQSKHQNPLVELNAVVVLKNYVDSRPASEALIEKLESKSGIIQGRALDGLCAHSSLVSKRAVIDYLRENLLKDEVVDKIYRSFDPKNKGGEEFVKAIDQMLNTNPDHPQWEKLVALRDRLSLAQATVDSTASAETTEALREVDEKLTQVIPLFTKLDPTTQSALRAAEQPFTQAINLQNLPIDKAPTVLEYCKALDLILDRHLGQKHLFPKLDGQLHDFQTLWHRVGFGEDYPSADKVMGLLGLKGKLTVENFPLHKAKMMCGTFFNGKIVQDRFKVFDGLRAWAVIFLVFARKIPHPNGPVGPLVKLANGTDEKCISVAKRLMMLQDLRNPAAHRQTYTDLASVTHVRNEAIELLNTVLDLII